MSGNFFEKILFFYVRNSIFSDYISKRIKVLKKLKDICRFESF